MKRELIPIVAVLFALGGTPAMAADPKTDAKPAADAAAPSGPENAAGETSDRTPQKDTATPLSQTDKTSNVPAGVDPAKPGTTSDRTPEAHKSMDKDAKAGGMKPKSDTDTKTE